MKNVKLCSIYIKSNLVNREEERISSKWPRSIDNKVKKQSMKTKPENSKTRQLPVKRQQKQAHLHKPRSRSFKVHT